MGTPQLTDVHGIGVETARLLAEHGLGGVSLLAAAEVATIEEVPGFGPARAVTVKRAAGLLLTESGAGEDTAENSEPEAKDKKTKKKKKKDDKKGKKSKKGKSDKKKKKKKKKGKKK